ncbi:hypothetical protein ACS0TY_011587 [Phlomoides rotata]
MELNLFTQMADTTVYEGEGGGYYAWTPAKSPVLSQAVVGAGKLVLHPRGFALPHYADTYKIAYVVQGECTVGIILPNSGQEQVMIIKKGDALPVVMGSISWWFNGGDSDVTMIFLGESSRSYNPGQFDYFFLTGAAGLLGGFSTEFISKIYGFNKSDAQKLTKSQPNAVIAIIDAEIKMPNQPNCKTENYVVSLETLIPNSNGCAEMTADNYPSLDRIGLSAGLKRLEAGSVSDPCYTTDGSHRIIYVLKGSGRVQIVGLNGALALDTDVNEGHVFVVPRYFAAAELADENGMDFFYVSTSPRPVMEQLAGITSPFKALSSSVLQSALNVSPEFVELLKTKLI